MNVWTSWPNGIKSGGPAHTALEEVQLTFGHEACSRIEDQLARISKINEERRVGTQDASRAPAGARTRIPIETRGTLRSTNAAAGRRVSSIHARSVGALDSRETGP